MKHKTQLCQKIEWKINYWNLRLPNPHSVLENLPKNLPKSDVSFYILIFQRYMFLKRCSWDSRYLYPFLKNKFFQYLCVIEICIFSTITSDVRFTYSFCYLFPMYFWSLMSSPLQALKGNKLILSIVQF